MTKDELEAAISGANIWSGRSTLVLAVGILGEYAILPFLEKRRWYKLAKILFAAMVVAGIVGEYKFSSQIAQSAGELQRMSDADLGDALHMARDADTKLSTLESRLIRILGPRDLSQEQLDRITSKLAVFAGIKVDVYGIGVGNPYTKTESEESIRLAKQLVGAMSAARIEASGWVIGSESCAGQFGGANVIVSIAENGPRDTRIAFEIIKVLEPEIDTFPEIAGQVIPPECAHPLSARSKELKPSAALTIVIGRKIPSLLSPASLGIQQSPK